MNDRALREVVVGLGGPGDGYPREHAFDIVAASEVMAIFCLAVSLADWVVRSAGYMFVLWPIGINSVLLLLSALVFNNLTRSAPLASAG